MDGSLTLTRRAFGFASSQTPLGVGAGKTSGFRVGHEDRWEFLIAGDPMRQVAEYVVRYL